jgi:hypothetical protein
MCNGHAGQRTGIIASQARIGGLGLRQGQVAVHVQEGVEVAGRDAVQEQGRQFGGGNLALAVARTVL